MKFKLAHLRSEVIQIDAKLQRETIARFLDSDRLKMSSRLSYKTVIKNMPFWHLTIEKSDTIKTTINHQKTFNTS
jgi:hypothetical protein